MQLYFKMSREDRPEESTYAIIYRLGKSTHLYFSTNIMTYCAVTDVMLFVTCSWMFKTLYFVFVNFMYILIYVFLLIQFLYTSCWIIGFAEDLNHNLFNAH